MAGESIREQLESAFKEVDDAEEEEQEAGGSSENSEVSVGDAEAEASAGGEAEGSEAPGEGGDDDGGTGDESKGEESESVSSEASAEGDAGSLGGDTKAPVSWTPAAREHWAAIPPEAQAEIAKRESDIARGLQQASGHKRVADEYYKTVAPFQSFIQAEGSSPAQAITELMTTAAQLTMGSPAKKAEVVKNIINQYGVDIGMLDDVLSGQEVSEDPNAPLLQSIQKELAPIKDFMGQVNTGRTEAVQQVNVEASTELSSFQESHSEFYEDLREDMADLMEMATNRGRTMTLEQAYGHASNAHPEIGPILKQRVAAEAGKVSASAIAAKKAAASSIRGTPNAGSGGSSSSDTRAIMSELWDEAEGSVGHG